METRFLIVSLALFSILFATGCATGRPSHAVGDEGSAHASIPSEVNGQPFGPPLPVGPYGPVAPAPQPQYGPDVEAERAVVLVLGPGLARGFAYIGVIRALSDAKIKVGAIFGTEMGALIGALYALDGNVNKLEWNVQHFKEDVFDVDASVLSRLMKNDPAEKLDLALARSFGATELSATRIPMRVLAQPAGQGAKTFDHGSLRLFVRGALGNVNGFSPIEIEGVPTGTAGAIRPFDVQDAKALGIGPVIVVSVLDPKDVELFSELKDADLVLQPDVANIAKTDFKKRTAAVFAGKSIVREHLDEIRRLVSGGKVP